MPKAIVKEAPIKAKRNIGPFTNNTRTGEILLEFALREFGEKACRVAIAR
jgi:hypothetical protein